MARQGSSYEPLSCCPPPCFRSTGQVQEVAEGLEAGLMRDGSTSRQMYAGRLASLVTRWGEELLCLSMIVMCTQTVFLK